MHAGDVNKTKEKDTGHRRTLEQTDRALLRLLASNGPDGVENIDEGVFVFLLFPLHYSDLLAKLARIRPRRHVDSLSSSLVALMIPLAKSQLPRGL